MKLSNKIIAITGSSSGIGEACAMQCAQAGANLILIARRRDKLESLADRIVSQFKVKVHTLNLDVRNKLDVIGAFNSLSSEWSNIDVLINNAGLALGRDSFQEAKIDEIEQMIDTNFKGLSFVTKSVLPNMIARNSGHIVNIGSISGHEVYSGGSTYCATKHAVTALTSGLKMDLLGTNIRVTLISPGMVETEFSLVRFHNDQQKAGSVYAGMTPLTADDIADTVLFSITRPARVNISEILVLPTDQASVGMVNRK